MLIDTETVLEQCRFEKKLHKPNTAQSLCVGELIRLNLAVCAHILFLQIAFQDAPTHETIVGLVILIGLAQRKTVSIVVLVSLDTNIWKSKKKNHLQFRIN